MLDLSKIRAQGNTIIMIDTKNIIFLNGGNVIVNLYFLLSSALDVNLPFFISFHLYI